MKNKHKRLLENNESTVSKITTVKQIDNDTISLHFRSIRNVPSLILFSIIFIFFSFGTLFAMYMDNILYIAPSLLALYLAILAITYRKDEIIFARNKGIAFRNHFAKFEDINGVEVALGRFSGRIEISVNGNPLIASGWIKSATEAHFIKGKITHFSRLYSS